VEVDVVSLDGCGVDLSWLFSSIRSFSAYTFFGPFFNINSRSTIAFEISPFSLYQ
jgi:hypothetical protein